MDIHQFEDLTITRQIKFLENYSYGFEFVIDFVNQHEPLILDLERGMAYYTDESFSDYISREEENDRLYVPFTEMINDYLALKEYVEKLIGNQVKTIYYCEI